MNFDGVTPLQIVTLVIAVLGVLLSAIALTWQIVAWRLAGNVVKVELLAGGVGNGAVVSGAIATFNPQSIVRQGFSELVFVVRARNVGRMAVDITHWSIATRSGWGFSVPGLALNPDLPKRLEAGSVQDFYAPIRQTCAAFDAASSVGGQQNQIRGSVTLGTGQECRSSLQTLPKIRWE